ncbi:MAG: hypothetical protein ACI959_001103 [Limisphaerales bacterium]|jgi:hypothetical protein
MRVKLEICQIEKGCHCFVEATFKMTKLRLLVDTGASHTILDNKIWSQLSGQKEIHITDPLAQVVEEARTVMLGGLQIGKFKVPLLSVCVRSLEKINIEYLQLDIPPIAGVLGADLLVKTNAIIDLTERKIKFNALQTESHLPAFLF